MKKIILLAMTLCVIFVGTALADAYHYTTATADTVVCTRGCVFGGIVVATDATNAVTIDFYDNSACSGSKFLPSIVVPTSATDRMRAIGPPEPIVLNDGMCIDITTAGAVAFTVLHR